MKKVRIKFFNNKNIYYKETYETSRDIPTYKEIEEFNKAIIENKIDILEEMVESHPLRYFFNLKLDKKEFSIFHKIIIYENKLMFNSILEVFKNKFSEEKGEHILKFPNSFIKSQNEEERKSTSDSEEIEEIKLNKLLSLKDKDGNTPILFAAYKGYIDIISKLIELGVKYDIINKSGLNVIHMAAQNDMGNVIIYFKERFNFNLYQNDNQGNNPIHWASSNSSKFALEYLLYYLRNDNKNIINNTNKDRQTALHLAVLTNASGTIIKKLIKKGINVNIKDKNDLSAIDLTKNNIKHENINKLILDYTSTNFLGLNFHINDFRNNYFKFIVFISILIIQIICTNYLLLPFIEGNIGLQNGIKLIYYILSLSFIVDFIYIINSNPGTIMEKINESLLDLVSNEKDVKKICPICMVYQKKYSKHCYICHKCIEIYDHHCHWINNCVGAGNKKQFIIFLSIMLSFLCFSYFLSFQILIMPINDQYYESNYFMSSYKNKIIISSISCLINLFFCFPVGYILKNQMETDCPPKPKKNEIKEYRNELKEINKKNSIINQLQIKED